MKFTKYIILIFIIPLYSQFGKNIVQYDSFNWHYIQTKYFDIYYYDTDINAQYVANESEQAYKVISHAIGWDLNNRVPIIIYNSHNDFQQTNVIDMYMPEGVGGVTELYKNRVVIPYDGSLKQFRDVLYHELVHAFINDYIYKGNIMNMQNQSIRPIPLWMNEGLAEFISFTWNAESEMWVRDLIINGDKLPSLNELNGFLAYRGGQSIWKFLVEKLDSSYLNGESKSPTIIANIFNSIAIEEDLNSALKNAIGINLEELESQWHQHLKEEYWPDINNRSSIKDISIPLIDYKKLKTNYNIAPSISPNGREVVFYSNKDGYMGVYLISSDCNKCHPKLIKRILKGDISTTFEELHILKPGISWSPDSKKIILAAKSEGEDALIIIDIETNQKTRYTFSEYGIKAIFQPSWNPASDNLISFIGCNDNQSDIYIYDLQEKTLENLTNDVFTDKEVIWSNDGKNLLFSSDRYSGSNIQYDLYSLSLESRELDRLSNTEFNEYYPIPMYSDSLITYISDANGIQNIYLMNYKSNNQFNKSLTNIFTGVTQLTAHNNHIFFTGLTSQQFGVYKLDSNLINSSVTDSIQLARWKSNFKLHDYTLGKTKEFSSKNDYRNYIFNPPNMRGIIDTTSKSIDSIITKDSSGNYIAHKYKTRFTMDVGRMSVGFGLNEYDDAQGMAQFIFSDILGDHKIYLGTETNIDFIRSDYSFVYRYLPKKIDWTGVFFHDGRSSGYIHENFDGDTNIDYSEGELYKIIDQQFLLLLNASRPFSKFQRFDFAISTNYWSRHKEIFTHEDGRSNMQYEDSEYRAIFDAKYIWDNTRWAYTYPNDGSRFYVKYKTSPIQSDKVGSITFDGRFYKSFSNGISTLFRSFIGFGFPRTSDQFYLGSTPSIWAGGGTYNPSEHYNINNNDFYFSEYVSPIRGIAFFNKNGQNISLFNFELRAPLLLYYFPTIKWLGQINAIAFLDIGGTWNSREWDITKATNWEERIDICDDDGHIEICDDDGHYLYSENEQGWVMTYGWGPRFILAGLPWQLNYSWSYNPFTKKQGNRHWEVTIGFDL